VRFHAHVLTKFRAEFEMPIGVALKVSIVLKKYQRLAMCMPEFEREAQASLPHTAKSDKDIMISLKPSFSIDLSFVSVSNQEKKRSHQWMKNPIKYVIVQSALKRAKRMIHEPQKKHQLHFTFQSLLITQSVIVTGWTIQKKLNRQPIMIV
jgi:hypothetical protein